MQKNRLLFFFILCVIASGQFYLSTGCAQIVQPTGGPRDTIPPQLDSARSTPNFQTNFEKQTIVLSFEEYIELKDVFTQVVISPPTAVRPEVKRIKYKRVELTFAPEEELRPNATYTINFGDAISDFTAGNVAPMRFVFSTGDYLDSLSIEGLIRDAETNEPVEDVLLMLYDNLADSVVRTERPFYFARTNKDGRFLIQNVKADTFKVFALEDTSNDYLYNQEAERIGFPDTPIILTDSSSIQLDIRFFLPDRRYRLLNNINPRYGLTKLVFTQPPQTKSVSTNQEFLDYYTETEGDTLRIWYHLDTAQTWDLLLQIDTLLDTIAVPAGNRAAFLESNKPTPLNNRGPTSHNPTEPLPIAYNQPIKSIDTSLIQCFRDTSRQRVYGLWQIDSTDQKRIQLSLKWEEAMNYELLLLPGAVTGFYGAPSDTLQLSMRTARPKDFGALTVNLIQLDSSMAYTFELILSGKIINEDRFQNTTNWSKSFPSIRPGKYEVRIVEDRNNNGRWDPGNYDSRSQPERIFLRPLEELRANWEVQAEFPLEFE